MGLTGHLAFAFDPADEARMIGVLSGDGGEGDDAVIKGQPRFEMVREDHYQIHRVLEVLAEGERKFSSLSNTIVAGKHWLMDLGMGSQYLFSKDEVADIALALSLVRSVDIDNALDQLVGEYEELGNDTARQNIHRLIENMRDEMATLAENKWALIAGMF